MERTGRPSSPPPEVRSTPPKPPATMAGIERLIASAIRLVRIEPEAPTMMPPTISAVLSSAMPAAAADRPVKAFSSEMTTGMSAPPIGSTNMLPRIAAETRIATNRSSDSEPAAMATAQPTAISSSAALTNCWPGSWIGRPGRISCSLPKAMFEPQKEIEPMIAAKRMGMPSSSGRSPPELAELGPGDERHRAAAHAVEQRHHLRHLGHLHRAGGRDADRWCRWPRRRRSARSRPPRG